MSNSKEIKQNGNGQAAASKRLGFLNNQIFYLIIVIILIVVIASILNPKFLTLKNFLNIMQQISILGILTMCMSLLMISGGLDISIGNMSGLIAIVFARMLLSERSIFLGVIVALVLGIVFGFINGFIIAKSKVTPLIITLGMAYVYLGIALIVGGGRPQSITGQFQFSDNQKSGALFHSL